MRALQYSVTFFKYWVISVMFLSLLSCSRQNTPQEMDNTSAPNISQQSVPEQATDEKNKAVDNFYKWANEKWLRDTVIPADKSGINNFVLIQNRVSDEINHLLETVVTSKEKTHGTHQLVVLHQSYLDMKARNQFGLKPLNGELKQIASLKTHADIAKMFAELHIIGVDSPINYEIRIDFKNSDRYIVYAHQSGLGIERDNYLGQDKRSLHIQDTYRELLRSIFSLASIDQVQVRADRVLELERQMAEMQWSRVDNRDVEKIYNIASFDSLNNTLSNLDFAKKMQILSIPKNYPINVNQPDYFDKFNRYFISQDVETWKDYLRARLLIGYGRLLDEKFKQALVKFDIDRGLYEKQEPMTRQAVYYLNREVGLLLGKAYIENSFDSRIKTTVRTIIDNVVAEFRVAINESNRLTQATKMQALKKLDAMKFQVGYPDKWVDYSTMKLDGESLADKHKQVKKFELRRQINKLGKPIDPDDWFLAPQEVNAFYNGSLNTFVLLAGILKPPLFSIEGTEAEHYGGLGFVVGHEIGHGFDDQGSRFDADGNMRNWWTDQDRQAYDEVKSALLAQANEYEIIPGVFLNGELEIGEIMGDASGVEIAFRAFKKVVKSKGLNEQQAYADFFKQVAKTWRNKIRKDYMLLLLEKDPHPPAEYRANGILKNISEFHQVFNTKPGDRMYRESQQRVLIWQ